MYACVYVIYCIYTVKKNIESYLWYMKTIQTHNGYIFYTHIRYIYKKIIY